MKNRLLTKVSNIDDISWAIAGRNIDKLNNLKTEIDTKNILLESAYFDPRSIRKTAKRLNIDTCLLYTSDAADE